MKRAGSAVLFALAVAGAACSSNVAPVASVECMTDIQCDKCMTGMVGICGTGTCTCVPDLPLGAIGMYMSMAVGPTGVAYVSAYNTDYGDLMFAQMTDSGRVPDSAWVFVDGLPSGPPDFPQATIRDGYRQPGPDVGWYTSIAVTLTGIPMISYLDNTNHGLRFAALYGATGEVPTWTSYALETGDAAGNTVVGLYTSITLDNMNQPGVAYLVTKPNHVSEVHFIQATKPQPLSVADWTKPFVVEMRTNPAPPAVDVSTADIPYLDGDFVTSARRTDGSPILAYYDRPNGQLRVVDFSASADKFNTPAAVDGGNGRDVGWYPSITVTSDNKYHVTYLTFLDALHANLLFLDQGGSPGVVDDGYRLDNVNSTGVPEPVYHLIGDNSSLVMSTIVGVAYQDGTTSDLLFATRTNGTWTHTTIAGSEDPYVGAFGFWAAAKVANSQVVMASYAMNLTNYDQWVQIFREPISPP